VPVGKKLPRLRRQFREDKIVNSSSYPDFLVFLFQRPLIRTSEEGHLGVGRGGSVRVGTAYKPHSWLRNDDSDVTPGIRSRDGLLDHLYSIRQSNSAHRRA
jgi:hypothetical protein